MYIKDWASLKIGDSTREMIAGFTQKIKISDAIGSGTLLARLNATHSGWVNGNKLLYQPGGMKKSLHTWLEPYPNPILKHHDRHSDPVGRVVNAEYFDLPPEEEPNSPKGYIQLLAEITDALTVDQLLDRRLQTVSIGGGTKEAWCSVCNQNLATDGICSHKKGKKYAKDEEETVFEECYWILGEMDYKE